MAKEMMIVFVYDTECCMDEEDDPADAVLYFHPGWVSDTQRLALAGQVVGTAHCIKALFSKPVSITLQSGKFIIRQYGRYMLAVGSDRNIPDWVLKNRADLLTSMVRVYHGNLHTLAKQMQDPKRLAEKLYQVFETYLPVLQYGAHIFQRVPMLTLPKSATSMYMESMQILEECRKNIGVLGGIILYNNKILATQLSPSLTSYLTVVDPYRIKSPAETIDTDIPLPLGAQLLVVYVGRKTYNSLKGQASLWHEFNQKGDDMLSGFKKSQESEREKIPQTGMKRDKSLLFTAVPEEDHTMISPPTREDSGERERKPSMPDVVPFTNKPRQRPNKLSLSFKTQQSLDEESKDDEKMFTGQTSVCSTPMVEYKRLHGNILSICQNPDNQSQEDKNEDIKKETGPDVVKNIRDQLNLENEHDTRLTFLDNSSMRDYYINKPQPIRKLASVADIQQTFKSLTNRATSKFKLKRFSSSNDSLKTEAWNKPSTVTITDPYYPKFRFDGVAISGSLFNQYFEQLWSQFKQEEKEDVLTCKMKMREFDDFDSELLKSPQRTPKKEPKEVPKCKDPAKIPKDQSRRKALSLPLKSLSDSSDLQIGSEADSTSFKKKLSGVQLTPLMEKLSHLAFSDKSSGYGSRVMTPLEIREFLTPAAERPSIFLDKPRPMMQYNSDSESDSDCNSASPRFSRTLKCALLVTGQQNMSMLMLLDMSAAHDAHLVHALWETSLNCLGPIEQKCMEPVPGGTEPTDYSYLTLDPDWGTVNKGGPWPALDIATMGLIHSQFDDDPEMSEFILRSDESVVVGASCGGSRVYYGETGARQPGPPGPADALAAAPLRARRRLLRDHATLLL